MISRPAGGQHAVTFSVHPTSITFWITSGPIPNYIAHHIEHRKRHGRSILLHYTESIKKVKNMLSWLACMIYMRGGTERRCDLWVIQSADKLAAIPNRNNTITAVSACGLHFENKQ